MLLSIIVSVYNEQDMLKSFWASLSKEIQKMDFDVEVLFTNDGSIDNSLSILKEIEKREDNVKIISFSRNFGHEAAMIAGIDKSSGDAIICMDADLQHPTTLISKMVDKYKEGNDICNMSRKSRADASLWKRITSSLFYKVINKISVVKFEPNASDFFLISKKVSQVLKNNYRERIRFLRGFIQNIGFKSAVIEFDSPSREAGESKYSFVKLFMLSIDAIVVFSRVPLYFGFAAALFCFILSISLAVYSIIMKFMQEVPPGYTTLIVLVSFLFAIQFLLIGFIGLYMGHLYEENKKRPIYIIDEDNSALKVN